MRSRVTNLRAALREIKAVVRTAKPEPMFVMIENDPEGMSEDDGMVAGTPYEREVGESREAFWSRLRSIACEKGTPVYFVGRAGCQADARRASPRGDHRNRGHGA
jgi:hypothetical protein